MPEAAEGFVVYTGEEAREVCLLVFCHAYKRAHLPWQKFHLAEVTAGCVVGPGGAMHPYRFVTNLLAKLLDKYPDRQVMLTSKSVLLSLTHTVEYPSQLIPHAHPSKHPQTQHPLQTSI